MDTALKKLAAGVKDIVKAACIFIGQNLFFALAEDKTALAGHGPFLVIAPHPDDETLGCGAFIARARRLQQQVRIVIVTDGREGVPDSLVTSEETAALRRTEALTAAALLGVTAENVVFLNIPDSQAHGHQPAIEEALRREIESLRPRLVFSPYEMDKHEDHRAATRAVNSLRRKNLIPCPVYEYPIWFWISGIWDFIVNPERFRLIRRMDMQGYSDIKMEALKAHRSQFPHLFDDTSSKSFFRPLTFQRQFFSKYEIFFEGDSR
jgi:LmbE family N-acetylglucosaminyl deacetylase